MTFSPGANELIDAEFPSTEKAEGDDVSAEYVPGTDIKDVREAAEDPDWSVGEYLEGGPDGWSLDWLGVVDEDGESRHDMESVGVQYVEIDGAQHLDPPNSQPSDRPRKRISESEMYRYQ